MVTVDQLHAARAALKEGESLLAQGQIKAARRRLDYASRIVPEDDYVSLQAALARLQDRDSAAAIALLQPLAKRHHRREILVCLINAYRMGGDFPKAAEVLHHLLGQFALLSGEGMNALANELAQQAGFAGWCGLGADGALAVGCAPDRRLTVAADGVVLDQPFPRLPDGWQRWRTIDILIDGVALLGSPISVQAINRIEAFVEAVDGDLRGWAWMPGQPDTAPVLHCVLPDGSAHPFSPDDLSIDTENTGLLSRPRGFSIPSSRLPKAQLIGEGMVRITGPEGQDITGSPLDADWERRSVTESARMLQMIFPAGKPGSVGPNPYPSIRAGVRGRGNNEVPAYRGIDIVIPVYRGLDETWACLQSLLIDPMPGVRIVVVEDASPEPALVAALDTLVSSGKISLLRQQRNRGFPATANVGMRHADGRDVVLLNSDTIIPAGWLKRLQQAAYSAPDIGTVTPLSNDATICSYPSVQKPNDVPTARDVAALDRAAWSANGDTFCDIPTAVGFCMYIRHDCLEKTGALREDLFAQGYGEEVDFCLRARALGWRHVAHSGVFVGHIGGASFGGAKAHLIRRNGKILNGLHPGFDALIAQFQENDSLASSRRALDRQRWLDRHQAASILLISHARGGGVSRHVLERARRIKDEGKNPVLIAPFMDEEKIIVVDGGPPKPPVYRCQILDPLDQKAFPNLIFDLPSEQSELVAFLRALDPVASEWHHFIGHHPIVAEFHRLLCIPQTIMVHDFSLFCPRITLTQTGARYCGEPSIRECNYCVADHGSELDEAISVPALIARSAQWLGHANAVIAPSADTARRMERHFPGLQCKVQAWEPDIAPVGIPAKSGDIVRVCVAGAIGQQKGYETILACARDAAERKLPIHFHVVGFTIDDERLLETGHVDITGPFKEEDALALIRTQNATIGFLPSQWPETWSYVLSDLRKAGLTLIGFDIGAQAERIRNYDGKILPIDLSATKINDVMMELMCA